MGTGISYSLNQILKLIEKELNVKIKPKYMPNIVKNYVMVTQASTEKAYKDLGFKAEVELREGIMRIAKYYSSINI